MTKVKINHEEHLSKTKNQAKKYIIEKLKACQIKKIYIAAENKSKVRDYVCNKTRESKYPDMTCRWCQQQQESQVHILTECAEFKEITKLPDMNYTTKKTKDQRKQHLKYLTESYTKLT